jgi:hypothetical protein
MSYLADTDWIAGYLVGQPPALALLERLIPAGLATNSFSTQESRTTP